MFGSKTAGSVFSIQPAAVRLVEPEAVAVAESVMAVAVTAWIVVPAGMPVPVTVCPTISHVVLLMPTTADPLANAPVRTVGVDL